VVEHAYSERYAVATLTESEVPAVVQPAAEAAIADVAPELRDQLRGR